ncbi:MAG: uroporphyrinogen decarboxylase family protein [Archaeoglobaceae archaeon]
MEVEEVRRERLERLEAFSKGKEPDRVPIYASSMLFPAKYAGITAKEMLFDYQKYREAVIKVAKDFDFDLFRANTGLEGIIFVLAFVKSAPDIAKSLRFLTGPFHQIIGDVFTKWPGIELDVNAHPQFIGKEIMKREEYDEFIRDPIGYIHRVALPRICRNLSNLGSLDYHTTLLKYGAEIYKSSMNVMATAEELKKIGYPSIPTSWGYAPLDFIADLLRDIKGVSLDLYKVPDKVKAAVEVLTPLIIEMAEKTGMSPETAKKLFGTDVVWCFYPLHMTEYLNPKLYNEFYWPYLNRVFQKVAEMGMINFVLFEGRHDAHLETLLEAPKKKVIGVFEKTDPRKVREVVGDRIMIATGPPNSLLISGTPQKVEEYMKKLLEDCKEGGLMIYPGADGGISRDAKPENVRAVIEAVKKYGRY